MKVTINGVTEEVAEGLSVADAVKRAGHEGAAFGVAVALNGEVVPRSTWADTSLSDSDLIEVLVAAQGG